LKFHPPSCRVLERVVSCRPEVHPETYCYTLSTAGSRESLVVFHSRAITSIVFLYKDLLHTWKTTAGSMASCSMLINVQSLSAAIRWSHKYDSFQRITLLTLDFHFGKCHVILFELNLAYIWYESQCNTGSCVNK